MNDLTHEQLIAELARDLVAQVAPEELPLFRAHRDAYFTDPDNFTDPDKALKRQTAKDEMLGFGAGEAVLFLTPIVFAVMQEVVTFLWEEVKKHVKEEGSDRVGNLVKELFKKFRLGQGKAHEPLPPVLTSAQLQRVHTLTFEKARQFNLPEPQARQLADELIGGLVASG